MFKRNKSSSVEERNIRLMHYLRFTDDDLVMNRQGKLSQAQLHYFERLIKNTGSNKMWQLLPVFMIIFGGAAILIQLHSSGFFETPDKDTIIIVAIGLGGSFLVYVILMFYAMYRASEMSKIPPDQYEVQTISGKVRSINDDTPTINLSVGRYRICTDRYQGGEAFVKGQRYRIYCTKGVGNLRYLLTAEAE